MIINFSDFPLRQPEYFPGDVFTVPPPASPKVRLRVRAIEQVTSFGPWDTNPQPVLQYVLQLYTIRTGGGGFDWMDAGHDRKYTAKYLKENGYQLESKVEGQLDLFAA